MNAIGLRLATWLVGWVPRRAALSLAAVAGDACWCLMPWRRRTIDGNLALTAATSGGEQRRRLCRSTFRHIARNSVDFLRLPLMNRHALVSLIGFQGRNYLDEALAQGRGAIIISGHIGAWELCGPFVAAHGYRMSGYVEDAAVTPSVFRIHERIRAATGMSLIPLSKGARAGYQVLRRGEVLGVLADRVITGRGLPVNFASGTRELPRGPAALARWSGAPVLVGHLIPTQDRPRAYTAILEPLAVAPSASDAEVTRAIAAHLSAIVSRYPDQWFVFQPKWITSFRTD